MKRLSLLFTALVLPTLLLIEVRPNLRARQVPWPGHAQPFTLPEYLPGDCAYYRAAIVSMLQDGDLDLRNNVNWQVLGPDTQVAVGARGEWYPKHPLGLSLAALPFYALLGDAGLLAFNLLQLLALEVLMLLWARRFAGEGAALATLLAFALGTLLRPAAFNFSPDVFSTLLVVGGAFALTSRRAALAGALLGAAVAAKWTNLAFVPVAAIWAGAVLGQRAALWLLGAAAPFLLALAALDAHMFGSPWITPYDHVGVGLLSGAARLEPSHRTRFDLPFWHGLWIQLTDAQGGLLRSAPVLLLAPPGLVLLWRRARSEAVLLCALSAVQLAVFAQYRDWSASNFGHRFLLTVVALGAPPVAALLSRALGESSPALV